jgi:hypothetical protein
MDTNTDYAEQQRAAVEAMNAALVPFFEEFNKAIAQAFETMQAAITPVIQEWNRVIEENKPLIDEMLRQYEESKERKTPLI